MTISNQLVVSCLKGSKPKNIMTILVRKVIATLLKMVIMPKVMVYYLIILCVLLSCQFHLYFLLTCHVGTILFAYVSCGNHPADIWDPPSLSCIWETPCWPMGPTIWDPPTDIWDTLYWPVGPSLMTRQKWHLTRGTRKVLSTDARAGPPTNIAIKSKCLAGSRTRDLLLRRAAVNHRTMTSLLLC